MLLVPFRRVSDKSIIKVARENSIIVNSPDDVIDCILKYQFTWVYCNGRGYKKEHFKIIKN